MNKNQKIITTIIIVLTIVGVIYIVVKFNNQDKRINELESDRLRLQKFLFSKYGTSADVVSSEIKRLKEQFKEYPDTIINLERANTLYHEGHTEEAVRKLVVIIENKIKQKLEMETDSWFMSLNERNKKYATFDKLLNRAKQLDWINDLQYSIAFSSVNIRHGESHKEGFKDEKTLSHICMLGSIELIRVLVLPSKLNEVAVSQKLIAN